MNWRYGFLIVAIWKNVWHLLLGFYQIIPLKTRVLRGSNRFMKKDLKKTKTQYLWDWTALVDVLLWNVPFFKFESTGSVCVLASRTDRDSVIKPLYSYSLQLKMNQRKTCFKMFEFRVWIYLHWYCIWFTFNNRINGYKIKVWFKVNIRFFMYVNFPDFLLFWI